MWEYVKGSEADFEGAPEWATYYAEVMTCGKRVTAWESEDGSKYVYERGCEDTEKNKVFEDGFINWCWSNKPVVIAERRKVDDLQSRVNDANLGDALKEMFRDVTGAEIRIGSGVAPGLHSGPVYELIAERGTRYGEFKDGAAIMQQLKAVMKFAPKWQYIKPSQKEALEMIQHKIGRILNGDPDYDDNWKDIAGYATLIVKELSE